MKFRVLSFELLNSELKTQNSKLMVNPDYLMLGHFTRDVLPDGTTTPGGTSLYAALTAHHLGRDVGVVSAPAGLPVSSVALDSGVVQLGLRRSLAAAREVRA